jgi:hypothetical protein
MTKRPWHLWLVGVIALLWNSIGAVDYVMTQTKNEAYMSGFTEIQLEYFYGLPAWVVAAWAIAIWASVLGSILLLMTRKLCVRVFLISLLGVIITSIQNYGLSDGYEVMGGTPTSLIFPAIIFIIATGLYFYSRSMSAKGLLH